MRLAGGRVEDEGRVEVRLEAGGWGVVCGDGWGVRDSVVMKGKSDQIRTT